MNYGLKWCFLAPILVLVLIVAIPVFASAQTTTEELPTEVAEIDQAWFEVHKVNLQGKSFSDFVVAPGKIELEIPRGESRTVILDVTNRLSDDRRFKIEVEDTAAAENAEQTVQLLGDREGPYTLRDYIYTQEDFFDIDLGERALIPVTISIPPNADPGGRYGSVLISTVKRDDGERESGDAAPRSPIIARIGTLFFVTVPGDIEYEGELKNFSTTDDKIWYESGPVNFGIVYENTGSVHVNPYGTISITNMLGEEVGYIESDPWFTMPKSLRLKNIPWDRELLLGRYTAHLQLNRGYGNIIDEATVSFWVLPWKFLLTLFTVLFVFIFLVRYIARNFEFKRKA